MVLTFRYSPPCRIRSMGLSVVGFWLIGGAFSAAPPTQPLQNETASLVKRISKGHIQRYRYETSFEDPENHQKFSIKAVWASKCVEALKVAGNPDFQYVIEDRFEGTLLSPKSRISAPYSAITQAIYDQDGSPIRFSGMSTNTELRTARIGSIILTTHPRSIGDSWQMSLPEIVRQKLPKVEGTITWKATEMLGGTPHAKLELAQSEVGLENPLRFEATVWVRLSDGLQSQIVGKTINFPMGGRFTEVSLSATALP